MREVAIGDVCELINGRAFKPSDWSAEGLPIVRIQNLNNEDAPFNRYSGEVRQRFLIDSGALLFSWSGTPGTSFGAFFWHRGPAILNQHIFHVLPKSGIDKNYLRYALNGRIERIIAQAHGGVGLQHITKDKLEATTIPVPPVAEQRRIANILDKADTIRRKRKEASSLTEELLRSAFLEMFGDPVTNPKGWPMKPLGELANQISDGTHKTPVYQPAGVPFLSAKNVRAHRIDWVNTRFISEREHQELIKRCRPERGDVLLTKSGTIGEAAVVDRDLEFSLFESVALLKLKDVISSELTAALLNTPSVRRLYGADVKGVGVKHLHLIDIRKLPTICPPRTVQARYDELVRGHRALLGRQQRGLAESAHLFDGLVARAFSTARTEVKEHE